MLAYIRIYAIRVGGIFSRSALDLFYYSKRDISFILDIQIFLIHIAVLVNPFSYLYTQTLFHMPRLGCCHRVTSSRCHEVWLYLRYISKDALDALMIIDFNSIYVS